MGDATRIRRGLSHAEQQLGKIFRAFNLNPLPSVFKQLEIEMRTAHNRGLTVENSRVYKSAERFVKSTEKTKDVADEGFGSAEQKKVTFKIWDIGGQEVCTHTDVIMRILTRY